MIHIASHPLIQHKLGLLREADISTKSFRELSSEISMLLTYEATSDLILEPHTINCWNGDVEVKQIKGKKITIVPILRAGLGMLDGVIELLPNARISVVGLYRDEETLQPVPYFEKMAGCLHRLWIGKIPKRGGHGFYPGGRRYRQNIYFQFSYAQAA